LFFEGSEKKVEIVVKARHRSLRDYRDDWPRVVAKANARVLSTISNGECDAFLLSESSLFVFDRSCIMITCGTTSMIDAIEEIFTFIPLAEIDLLMYERKNELFPEAQPTAFEEDVARLERYLPGRICRLGTATGNHVHLFHYGGRFVPPAEDMTLELLMHDLTGPGREAFGSGRNAAGETVVRDRILEGFLCDDFHFDPVGYSLNGIRGREYYTIHVTPEDSFSYASFETNHVFKGDLQQTMNRVLAIFQPTNFAMVFFQRRGLSLAHPAGYLLDGEVLSSFCGYDIHFRNYQRA